MARDNIESSTFIQMYDKLSTGIRAALPSLAEVAFARQLIHDNTLSEVINRNAPIEDRTMTFLNVVRDRIRNDPSAFHDFVKLLLEQNSMEYLGTKLKESLSKLAQELRKKQQNQAAAEKMLHQEDEMVISSPGAVVKSRLLPASEGYRIGGTYQAEKPTELPIYPSGGNELERSRGHYREHRHYQKSFKTPESDKLRNLYAGDYTEALSEPAALNGRGAVFSEMPNRRLNIPVDIYTSGGKVNEFIAMTRHAAIPEDMHRISSSGLANGHPTKMFQKANSELELPLLDSMSVLLPSANSSTSTDEYLHPPPQTSSDHSYGNLPEKMKQLTVNISGNRATTSSTCAAVSTNPSLPAGRRPTERTATSTSTPMASSYRDNSRNGTTANVVTGETTSNTYVAQDTIHGLNKGSSSREALGNSPELLEKQPAHEKATLERAQVDKSLDGHKTTHSVEISTTAATPLESLAQPLTGSQANRESSRVANDHRHHAECSAVFESQTTEPGSNTLSYRQMSRHSSVLSTSSDESIESLCNSPEVDPIQASEQSPGECHPLVSGGGGLMPAGCRSQTTNEKRKQQRCKQCTKLKKESNALAEKLNKVQRTLSMEREQSTHQVSDLKTQLCYVEHTFTQYKRDSEQRHKHVGRTIQRLQRELGQIEIEKASLKSAYDACLSRCEMLKIELQRAESLQCQDSCNSEYSENTCTSTNGLHVHIIPPEHSQYSHVARQGQHTSNSHSQTLYNSPVVRHNNIMHASTNSYMS